MKKLLAIFTLGLVLFTLTGCNMLGGSNQSTNETTESSTLKAEKTDISNSVYSLKVRKNMNLVSGKITFTEDKMEWLRTYNEDSTTSSESSENIILTSIQIDTKGDTYTITGMADKKEVSIVFTKIGNYQIKDEDGNVYSI
ncbi:hypothetical protein [Candidatus Enterococcus courvalinii]|uniref:Lipoprotein n=1 Tax=Candidatus Enterococcus courvalinii TaxID=2815329 RepID=A0ABS3HZP0_9ENTE|nr:hypothetical protein [Enterococcus sp. MSG2901]MBO0481881.1 hypothetical protein [Enterococcus sp. MSG2901]